MMNREKFFPITIQPFLLYLYLIKKHFEYATSMRNCMPQDCPEIRSLNSRTVENSTMVNVLITEILTCFILRVKKSEDQKL